MFPEIKAGHAVPIADKIDFQLEGRDATRQGDIIYWSRTHLARRIINNIVTLQRASTYIKQFITNLKGHTSSSTTVKYFNTQHYSEQITEQNLNKDRKAINDSEMDLIKTFRNFHSQWQRYAIFLKYTQNFVKERSYAKAQKKSINTRKLKSEPASVLTTMVGD